jgi:hypothetical protein
MPLPVLVPCSVPTPDGTLPIIGVSVVAIGSRRFLLLLRPEDPLHIGSTVASRGDSRILREQRKCFV